MAGAAEAPLPNTKAWFDPAAEVPPKLKLVGGSSDAVKRELVDELVDSDGG